MLEIFDKPKRGARKQTLKYMRKLKEKRIKGREKSYIRKEPDCGELQGKICTLNRFGGNTEARMDDSPRGYYTGRGRGQLGWLARWEGEKKLV